MGRPPEAGGSGPKPEDRVPGDSEQGHTNPHEYPELEIPEPAPLDLTPFYEDDTAFYDDVTAFSEKRVEVFRQEIQDFVALSDQEKIVQFYPTFLKYIDLFGQVMKMRTYATARYYTHTTENLKLWQAASPTWSLFQTAAKPFIFWWETINPKETQQYLDTITTSAHRNYGEYLLEFGPHTLSDPDADAAVSAAAHAASDQTSTTWDRNHQMVKDELATVSVEEYQELLADDSITAVTESLLKRLMTHPNVEVRRKAYYDYFQAVETAADEQARLYIKRAITFMVVARLRNYETPLRYRNINFRLPDEAVQNMVDEVSSDQSLTTLHRFHTLKAQLLNVDGMEIPDTLAQPILNQEQHGFAAAAARISRIMHAFHPAYEEGMREAIERGGVDPDDRAGKVTNAYAVYGSAGQPAYMFVPPALNDKAQSTLAHESGHVAHWYQASQENDTITAIPVGPMEESAAIFNELLLLDYTLTQEASQHKDRQRDLLFAFIDQARQQLYYQSLSIQFEQAVQAELEPFIDGLVLDDITDLEKLSKVVNRVQAKVPLDRIRALFSEHILQPYAGDDVSIPEVSELGFAQWPHLFKQPLSNYQYSFGYLVALGLYKRWKDDPSGFPEKYIQMLAAGGSKAPVELLQMVGIEIFDPRFWQEGLSVVEGWVNQLESLLAA